MSNFITSSIICACLIAATTIFPAKVVANSAAIAVIVSQDSAVKTISERQLRRLFLGKSIKLPSGSRAVLATYNPVMTQFNKKALKRSNAQVNAAWSRLKFSGRTLEPRQFTNQLEMMAYIADTPNAIGYIANENLSEQVRSVFTLN